MGGIRFNSITVEEVFGLKSCPRVGGIMLPTRGGKEEFVSSRAPVWGASSLDLLVGLIRESFKSCPRVGGIPSASVGRNYQKLFQVVPPCGGHLTY